jgi:hypothetical protein
LRLAVTGAARQGSAQAWQPGQPTHVVLPGPAGNALDALAWLMRAAMVQSMKASFVIDNEPGACMLVFGSSITHAVSPHIPTDIKYKPVDDFCRPERSEGPCAGRKELRRTRRLILRCAQDDTGAEVRSRPRSPRRTSGGERD